jgi:hypothetical protein
MIEIFLGAPGPVVALACTMEATKLVATGGWPTMAADRRNGARATDCLARRT